MSLFAELRRRNVFRVAAAYAVVAWLLVEVASVVLPTFKAPEWVMQVFTFLVILGFPLALIFAWAFELTPEGIKREKEVESGKSIARQTGRRLDFAIIGLLALAVVYFVVDKFMLGREPQRIDFVSVPVTPLPTGDSTAPEKSIAVLPFDNISRDPKDAYFADGIHDEILAQLSKIQDLKVISRTSVMRYRGEGRPSLPEIAAALGVAHILEGSVRVAADRVRITVQLIDAKTDSHLWAETYDRELTAADVFSIQGNVARTVADTLRVNLSAEDRERLAPRPTQNLEAYRAYLIGKQRMAKRTSAALAESAEYFQKAIELDPAFALAYVGLADSYTVTPVLSGATREEMYAKARAATEKALDLDDRLGEAYTTLGMIQLRTQGVEPAKAAFQRALELNPGYVTTYHWYGWMLRDRLGRAEEALALHRRALELDPLSAVLYSNLGEDLHALGRFDEALEQYNRMLEIDPGLPIGNWKIAMHHWAVSGRLDEAAPWLGESIRLDPGDVFYLASLGLLFLDLGDLSTAEDMIKRSVERNPEDWWANFAMQLLHLYRGDEATSLHYGRKAFDLLADTDYVVDWLRLVLLRDHDLTAGRYADALALYEQSWPDLLRANNPTVDVPNYRAAIDLALVLIKTGEPQRANLLLDRSFQQIHALPRLGWYGYGIADVQIYALQGDKNNALRALRQAVDEGWRFLWWFFLEHDPNLESLHGEPEYQAIIAEIEADMAAQLEYVREMGRNVELEPIPEVPTASQ